MRTLKIIIASYIGSTIGFLFGEYVIIQIAGEQIDIFALLSTGVVNIPPVLMGLVLSGLIGTISGVSFIKKGKIRAIAGGGGALFGVTVATLAIYNVQTFHKIYYLIYPLLAFSGWELGMYVIKDYIQLEKPKESESNNKIVK